MNLLADHKKFDWYQTIELDTDVTTSGCAWCGDPVWPIIKQMVGNLEGKRVLDLGSNAGIFCVRAAADGASECIGIESNTWRPKADYLQQAQLVLEHFETRFGKKLPVRYINMEMEKLVEIDLGRFDWCFAMASLYYTQDVATVIAHLSKIADNVLLRLRDENRINQITGLMIECGFELSQSMKEDWRHLNSPADAFVMYHYRKPPCTSV